MRNHRQVSILLLIGFGFGVTLGSIGCTGQGSDEPPEAEGSTVDQSSVPRPEQARIPAPPPSSLDDGTLSQEAYLEMVEDGPGLLLLDVRTSGEYESGHIAGAMNISHTDLEGRLGELESHKAGDVIVYCRSGVRTEIAISMLKKAGFTRVFHLEGDMLGWQGNGRPVE